MKSTARAACPATRRWQTTIRCRIGLGWAALGDACGGLARVGQLAADWQCSRQVAGRGLESLGRGGVASAQSLGRLGPMTRGGGVGALVHSAKPVHHLEPYLLLATNCTAITCCILALFRWAHPHPVPLVGAGGVRVRGQAQLHPAGQSTGRPLHILREEPASQHLASALGTAGTKSVLFMVSERTSSRSHPMIMWVLPWYSK